MPFAIHEDETPRQGKIAYLTFEVADSGLARTFFSAGFGWTFSEVSHKDGWQVEEIYLGTGLHGGHARPTVVPMYAVDDIATTVANVRESGGTATDPPGLTAPCRAVPTTRAPASTWAN